MEEKYMKTKKMIIITMCCLICVMAVAYAAFSTNLTINGTANITSTWKIEFSSIQKFDSQGNAKEIAAPTASGTTATFNVDLESPGDYIMYLVTIRNNGTLDAIINNIILGGTNNDAIQIEIDPGTGFKRGGKLASKSSVGFMVTIKYNPDVTTQPEKTNKQLTLTVDFVQDLGQMPVDDVTDTTQIKFNGSKYSVGSDLQIKSEHFYLIDIVTPTSFAAIAKYNIDIDYVPNSANPSTVYKGTGKQDAYSYGISTYEDAQAYLDKYKAYLEQQGVTVKEVRLITKDELTKLGCTFGNAFDCSAATYSWVYSTNYMIDLKTGSTVFYVDKTGKIDFTSRAALRPVIVMDYSEFD